MQFRKWFVMIVALCAFVPLVASAQTGGFGPPVLVSPVDGGFARYAYLSFLWNTTQGAVSYELQLSTSANFITGVQTFTVPNRTYFSTSSSQPDGIYYWRMRAYNGTLYSDWSEPRQFEVDTVRPLTPVLLAPASGSNVVGIRPTFSWEPVSDAVIYQVSVYSIYGGFSFDERVDASITSFTPGYDVYLYPGTYRWYVTVIDAAGDRSIGNTSWVFTLLSPEDAAPDLYLYGGDTDSNVTLRWSVVELASVYHIQVALDPDFSQIVRENDTLTAPEVIYSSYTYVSTRYYWRVRAGQGNGLWGPWSDTSNFIVNQTSLLTTTPALPSTVTPYYTPMSTATFTPSPTFTPTTTFTPTPTSTPGG